MASAVRVGRVFLVGDAAHRHPPTGGLGLTSAIQDVHNLCWKLAAVLAAATPAPALLDTYEPERRPSLERNAQRSLENAIEPLHDRRARRRLAREHRGGEPRLPAPALERPSGGRRAPRGGAARRPGAVDGVQRAERRARLPLRIRGDPRRRKPAAQPDDSIRVYEPSTRPGAPLPHAWIDDEGGTDARSRTWWRPGASC